MRSAIGICPFTQRQAVEIATLRKKSQDIYHVLFVVDCLLTLRLRLSAALRGLRFSAALRVPFASEIRCQVVGNAARRKGVPVQIEQ